MSYVALVYSSIAITSASSVPCFRLDARHKKTRLIFSRMYYVHPFALVRIDNPKLKWANYKWEQRRMKGWECGKRWYCSNSYIKYSLTKFLFCLLLLCDSVLCYGSFLFVFLFSNLFNLRRIILYTQILALQAFYWIFYQLMKKYKPHLYLHCIQHWTFPILLLLLWNFMCNKIFQPPTTVKSTQTGYFLLEYITLQDFMRQIAVWQNVIAGKYFRK